MEHIVEYLFNYHLKEVSKRAIGVNYTFRGVHSLHVKVVPEEGKLCHVCTLIRGIFSWAAQGQTSIFSLSTKLIYIVLLYCI